MLWWAMSPKKIDRLHIWEACLQDNAQPNVCVAGHYEQTQLLGIIYRRNGHI